jgi:hypothetical protein
MSAVESSENLGTDVLAKRFRWRPTLWIAAAGRRLHLQLCAAHGWATSLDVVESSSLYRMVAAALSQRLVLANSAIEHAVKTAMKRRCGAPRRIRN